LPKLLFQSFLVLEVRVIPILISKFKDEREICQLCKKIFFFVFCFIDSSYRGSRNVEFCEFDAETLDGLAALATLLLLAALFATTLEIVFE
jgi:hypothetical protein